MSKDERKPKKNDIARRKTDEYGMMTALVGNTYFSNGIRPYTTLLLRLVFVCLVSVSLTLLFTDIYDFPVDGLFAAAVCAVFTVMFYVFFLFFGGKSCIAAVIAFTALILLINADSVFSSFIIFRDYLFGILESRLLHTEQFITTSQAYLSGQCELLRRAAALYTVLISEAVSLIIVIATCSKLKLMLILDMLAVMLIPAFAAEILGFTPSMIFFVASLFALYSISISYEANGYFSYSSYSKASQAARKDERKFRREALRTVPENRVKTHMLRYGKYNANAVAVFIVTAALMTAGTRIFPVGTTIDYEQIWNNITKGFSDILSNIKGAFGWDTDVYYGDGYFSDGSLDANISIGAPSTAETPVLRVTLENKTYPVFLRGDIGVRFENNSWTSFSSDDSLEDAFSPEVKTEEKYEQYKQEFYDDIGWKKSTYRNFIISTAVDELSEEDNRVVEYYVGGISFEVSESKTSGVSSANFEAATNALTYAAIECGELLDFDEFAVNHGENSIPSIGSYEAYRDRFLEYNNWSNLTYKNYISGTEQTDDGCVYIYFQVGRTQFTLQCEDYIGMSYLTDETYTEATHLFISAAMERDKFYTEDEFYQKYTSNNPCDYFYNESILEVMAARMEYLKYDVSNFLGLQQVTVDSLRNTRVIFTPTVTYQLKYKKYPPILSFGDTVLRVAEGNGFMNHFQTTALTPIMSNPNLISAMQTSYYSTSSQYFQIDKQYDDYDFWFSEYDRYVHSYYTYVSDRDREYIDSFLDEVWKSDFKLSIWSVMPTDEMCEAICKYFRDNFTYSLTADNSSDANMTTLESFLTKTRSGHCALFATAMTLSLRSLGVPARYVTGYIVGGENCEQTADGYVYTVREKELHAWVEVYFEGIGWLPFDPTVAGSNGGVVSQMGGETVVTTTETPVTTVPATTTSVTTSKPVSEVSTSRSEITTDENTSKKITTSDAPKQKPVDYSSAITVAVSVLVAAVLALIVFLFLKSLTMTEKKMFRNFEHGDADKQTPLMYDFILKLLKIAGITVETGETPEEFAKRTDKAFHAVKKSNRLALIMPILEKSEFGKETITAEEQKAVFTYVKVMYHEIVRMRIVPQRLLYRIILFS